MKNILSLSFPNGLTVAELRSVLMAWPDTDEYGQPCEVWLETADGLSNAVKEVSPLNVHFSEGGSPISSDLIFSYR